MQSCRPLAVLRRRKRLLQRDVAEMAGVTRAFYVQVENGTRMPSLGVAKAMADALQVTLDEFFSALQVTKCNLRKNKATGTGA